MSTAMLCQKKEVSEENTMIPFWKYVWTYTYIKADGKDTQ